MSLIIEAMEATTILDKSTEPDGRGGVITQYTDGAEILAAYSFNTSTEARVGQSAGANNRYTITTRQSVILQFHDIVRRESDGKIFRVTSDGKDNKTPASSGLNIRQVEAEEWKLPANG
jgi:hypothetical protein